MQPYTPPTTEAAPGAEPPNDDADLEAVTPTKLTLVAGGVAIATALYTLLLAIQTMAAVRFRGALGLIVPIMFLLGAVLLVCAWYLRRFRGWAALGVVIVSGLSALLGLVWFFLGLFMGILTLMPLIVCFAAACSCALAAMCVTPARKADAARERLAEQGMDF